MQCDAQHAELRAALPTCLSLAAIPLRAAIGLRNRRAVTPNYQSRNVSIAGLNIPLNDLPGIARSTTVRMAMRAL